MIPVAQLLAPVSPDNPSGYDPQDPPDEDWEVLTGLGEIQEIYDELVSPATDMVTGTSMDAVGSSNERWNEIRDRSVHLFSKCKHLQLAYFICAAEAHTSGMAALDDILTLLHQLVARFWDTIHPQAESVTRDGKTTLDHSERLSLLSDAITGHYFIKALKNSPITNSARFDDFSILQADTSKSTGENTADFSAATDDTRIKDENYYDNYAENLNAITDRSNQLAAAVLEKTRDPEKQNDDPSREKSPLDLTELNRVVLCAANIIEPFTQKLDDGSDDETETGDDSSAGQNAPRTRSSIETRQDVVDLLERICQHYKKVEPTSPVPFMLQRVKKVVNMNFIDILGEFKLEGSPAIGDVIGNLDEPESPDGA